MHLQCVSIFAATWISRLLHQPSHECDCAGWPQGCPFLPVALFKSYIKLHYMYMHYLLDLLQNNQLECLCSVNIHVHVCACTYMYIVCIYLYILAYMHHLICVPTANGVYPVAIMLFTCTIIICRWNFSRHLHRHPRMPQVSHIYTLATCKHY